jgi:hypothetical protein
VTWWSAAPGVHADVVVELDGVRHSETCLSRLHGPERGTQDAKVAASCARGFTLYRCEQSPIGEAASRNPSIRHRRCWIRGVPSRAGYGTPRRRCCLSASAGESQFQNCFNFLPHKHPVDPFASVLTDCLRSRRCGGLAAIGLSRSIPYRRRPKPAPQSNTAMIASICITCDWTYAQKLTMTLKGHDARVKQ